MKLALTIAGSVVSFLLVFVLAMGILDAMRRRGYDPIGRIGRVLSPSMPGAAAATVAVEDTVNTNGAA